MLGHYETCEVRKAQIEKSEKVYQAIEDKNWPELEKLLED